MSGKITSSISDHLSRFLTEPAKFTDKSSQQIYRQKYYKNFDKFQFKVTSLKFFATVFAMILIQMLRLNNFLKSQQNYQISMFLIKISNTQSQFETLDYTWMDLKNKLYKRTLQFFCKRSFSKEKIHIKMKIMKDNSKLTVIYFLIYISNIFPTILITSLQVLLK